MTTIVKHGDTHDTVWTVNTDLTGCTVRLLARRKPRHELIVLSSTITDAPGGEVTHTLTGTLDVGFYMVELEVTNGATIATAPSAGFAELWVQEDLD